jgi:hypothetical protein
MRTWDGRPSEQEERIEMSVRMSARDGERISRCLICSV